MSLFRSGVNLFLGGGNKQNFARDNFLVFEKPTVLGTGPALIKQDSGSAEGVAPPEQVSKGHKQAMRSLSTLLKAGGGHSRKNSFGTDKMEVLRLNKTMDKKEESKIEEGETEGEEKVQKEENEGQTSIKNLFSNVRSFFS